MTNEDLISRLEGVRDETYHAYISHQDHTHLYLLYDRLRQIVEELKQPQPAEQR